MKKFGFLTSFLLLVFASCTKDSATSNSQNTRATTDDAVLVSTGTLNFAPGESNSGVIKIYKKSNGRYLLAIEKLVYDTNVDLELYLSKTRSTGPGSVKLFSFKCVHNDELLYEIPSSIDVMAFRFVVITNDIQTEAVANAELI